MLYIGFVSVCPTSSVFSSGVRVLKRRKIHCLLQRHQIYYLERNDNDNSENSVYCELTAAPVCGSTRYMLEQGGWVEKMSW